VPFHRRRQENEPDTPAAGVAPAAPDIGAAEPMPAPVPEAPPLSEPFLAPEAQVDAPVESQFQPVEGADEMLDMPLGTLIFRAGLIAPQQLEDALAEGLRSGKRLGEVLLSRGWLSEEDLSRLLAGQKGLPYADLEKIAVDRELAQAMSYDDASNEMALPVVSEFGLPVVAMADPDEAAMDRLRAQLGPEVRFVVGAPSVLRRLIDEVLGGAPAPELLVSPTLSERPSPAEPSSAYQYSSEELPAEPIQPEVAAAPEPSAVPEPASTEPIAAEPEPVAQEVGPIIADGEVDYPTFSEYQPLPEVEVIKGPDEQLPAEVQMGDYGYYDDSSLLEGNAWQAGDTGPIAPEPAPAIADPGADQYNTPQPEAEPSSTDDVEPPEEAEPPVEVEQPAEAAEWAPQTDEQPADQPVEQIWQEPSQEPAPEPAVPDLEQATPEQAPESPGEDDLVSTPAWMRGEVNVITADVADFIDSAAPGTPEYVAPAASENGDVAEREPVPVDLEPTPEAPDVETAEPSGLAQIEPADAEFAAETPNWASEPATAAGQDTAEVAEEITSEPAEVEHKAPAPPDQERGAFALVLRLADGDRMPIGSFGSVEEAQAKAAEVVKQFDEAKDGGWPFIGGRFLRPDTIVSIDVEQHGSGWGGSNSRGRMFSGGDGS